MIQDPIHHLFHNYPIDLNLESVQADPISHTKVDGIDYFILNDLESLQYIFKNHQNYQREGAFIEVLQEFSGKGVAATEGKVWERQRRCIMPTFAREKLDLMVSKMTEVTLHYMNHLDQHLKETSTVNIYEMLQSLTARIVIETLFSHSPTNEQIKALLEAEEIGGKFSARISMMKKSSAQLTGFFASQEEKYKKIFDDFAYGLIRERRNSSHQPHDVLQLLLEAQQQNSDITDFELKDQIITMFNGGHDTCGNNLSWAVYLLSQYPDIQKALRKEVAETIQNRPFELGDIDRMSLPTMILKESLRLFPPAFLFHRQCMNEDKIGDHLIPKGSFLSICPWVIHRNKKYWSDPFVFDPNRFAKGKDPNPAFIPFGGGIHVCPGQGFALREGALILASLFKHYNFELIEGQNIEAYGGIQLRPRYGINMNVTALS